MNTFCRKIKRIENGKKYFAKRIGETIKHKRCVYKQVGKQFASAEYRQLTATVQIFFVQCGLFNRVGRLNNNSF